MTPPSEPARAAIVILAAGAGARVGADVNKVLLPVAGQPLLAWSVTTALAVPDVATVVVVCRPGERPEIAEALAAYVGDRELLLIDGGSTRQQSEQAALALLGPQVASGAVDVIAIHDGARPLADVALYAEVIDAARRHGGAVPTLALPGLMARSGRNEEHLVGVQTPQAFRAAPLVAAYAAAADSGFDGTDTAAAFTRFASAEARVRSVPADPRNLKVTFAEDLSLAARLLAQR